MAKNYFWLVAALELACFAPGVAAQVSKKAGTFPSIQQSQLPACPGSYDRATWTNCVGTVPWGGDRKWGTDGKYVGEFRGGLINGQGTLTFSSGAKYVGAFRDGKQTGQGIEYRADGSIIRSGIWENGSFISGR